MTDVYDRLSSIVAEEVGASDLAIGPDTELEDIPGWDSVALAGVLLAIETEFDVTAGRAQVQALVRGADLARLCGPGMDGPGAG